MCRLFSWVFCAVFVFVDVVSGVCFRGCIVRFVFLDVLYGLFSWMFCAICFPGCFLRFVFLGVFCDVCFPGCFLRCLFSFFFFFRFLFRSAAEALVMSCVPLSSEKDGKLTGKGRGKGSRYWASRESLVTGSDKN